jgi:hypothetical protein
MAEAFFTADPESGESPFSVQFRTNSIGSYLWNFRDGTTSTEKNPSHTFTNPDPGTEKVYNVLLTVTTETGNKISFHNVHVQNAFSSDPDDLPTWALILLIVFGIIILFFIVYVAILHNVDLTAFTIFLALFH